MSNFNFGTPITTANLGFGGFSTQKPATGFGLGNSAFGTSTPAVTGNLTFPTTTTSAVNALTSNFTFGNTTVSSTSNPSGSFFSTPATTTTTAAPNLFNTSTTSAAPLSNLSFGNLPTSTNTNFGITTSTASTGGLNFGAPTTTAATTIATTTTSATSTNISLIGNTQTGGLFGAKPLGATTVTATTTTSVNKGLGGLDISTSNKGLSHSSNSPTVAKENLIPNELTQTIDSFKEFVRTQKTLSSDIARGSARPLNRCSEDTTLLMEMLTTLAGSVQRDRALADKLKFDTAKALQNSEIAQRTHDTPAGLQYENNAPLLFFMELVENFEQDLTLFRSQIETTEKHIQTMMTPRALTPQELTLAMSKIHESLIAVAGKLQGVHAKVQQQKEQYLNLRKYILKDSTNIFEENKSNSKNSQSNIGKITTGPTPFGPGNKNFLSSTTINSTRQPTYGSSNPIVWRNITPSQSTMNHSINTTIKPPTASLNFNPPLNLTAPLSTNETTSSFQLQKPPIGNKRGKH
ncbi:nucleoporin p58/p45 [Chelonus insularis]|uniref:nucleoporin p58/p45 n=1 Tax=Chelonus insularis TaxID=460826 RepID=UPI00158D633A|nr:nucleoporin p58/p45 [Chelonus insularis]